MTRPSHLQFNFDRLPKSAQRYIEKLERDVEYLQGQVTKMDAGDTPIVAHSAGGNIHLPGSSVVAFGTDPFQVITVCLQRSRIKGDIVGDVVEVRHSSKLIVRPMYSNLIEVPIDVR